MVEEDKNWSVYILRCKDKTLYTGATNDLEKRLKAHNKGTGAKYTMTRTPVRLFYTEGGMTKSEAQKREYAIKQLSRLAKLALPKALDKKPF